MGNSKNVKYTRVETLDIDSIRVHQLATLTPSMIPEQFAALKKSLKELGQLEPIVLYKGRLIDGRHRVKALRELGIGTVKAKHLDPSLSLKDVKKIILEGYETRRHQTPTQRAVGAYLAYKDAKSKSQNITMEEIAQSFGTNRLMISKAKKLESYAGVKLLWALYDGRKIKFPGTHKATDSLNTILQYYIRMNSERLAPTINKYDLTDDEELVIDEIVEDIKIKCNAKQIAKLADILYSYSKETDCITSRSTETDINADEKKEVYELDIFKDSGKLEVPLTRIQFKAKTQE